MRGGEKIHSSEGLRRIFVRPKLCASAPVHRGGRKGGCHCEGSGFHSNSLYKALLSIGPCQARVQGRGDAAGEHKVKTIGKESMVKEEGRQMKGRTYVTSLMLVGSSWAGDGGRNIWEERELHWVVCRKKRVNKQRLWI